MTLSVIVVSWNAKRYLLECLESILRQQTPHRLEIIVVDNASTDGSPEAVEQRFPQVTVLRNAVNLGFARANNVGVELSTGDYLFLINSDVVVETDCFRRMLAFCEDHRDVGVVGPRIVGANGRVQRSCMSYPTLWNTLTRALALDLAFPASTLFGGQLLTYWPHDSVRHVDVINGCFWLLRRAAIEDVGLLDERFLIYGEDIDWCRRFNDRGWGVIFFPEASAVHYGGASSSNAPVHFYVEMQRATYQYWVKHMSALSSMGYLGLNVLHHLVRIAGEVVTLAVSRQRRSVFRENVQRATAAIRWALGTFVQRLTGVTEASVSREITVR